MEKLPVVGQFFLYVRYVRLQSNTVTPTSPSQPSFVNTMKKGTRIWHFVPSPIQALFAAIPYVAKMIFRKRERVSYMRVDPGAENSILIKRNRVIQFNAFLRIEKSKVTNISKVARPDSAS